MKKHIVKIYTALMIVTVLLLVVAAIDFQLNITKRHTASGCEKVTAYSYAKTTDYSAPVEVKEEYDVHPRNTSTADKELFFYTIHQNAEVYVGDERIYSMRAKHDNFFGKTPGCIWNIVPLTSEDMEKPIRVVVYPVYKSSIGIAPDFYFGEKYEIVKAIIRKDMPAMLLSLVGIVAGLIFIGFILYNISNTELDKSLMALGAFSLSVSLWNLSDLSSMSLWFTRTGQYLVPILMLQLVSVPFTLFIKELCTTKDKFVWYIPCIASFAVQILTILLQLSGVQDFRQTLWMTHVVMILTVLVTLCMIVYEVRTIGWNAKLKRGGSFIVLCMAGFVIDLILYYVGKGKYPSILGMLGFNVYVIASGAFFLRDAKQLMTVGMKARNFERMAFHDQLTGLYNRTAFTNDTINEEFSPEKCIVAVFDLNDLKSCNDKLGHEKGDIYIRECANIIQRVFGEIGNCYRMGGDEFCVLLQDVPLDQCKQRMQEMKEQVKKCNERYPEIKMGIACGYELYDKRIDYDINDTSRRADKMMYREKYSMKEKKE